MSTKISSYFSLAEACTTEHRGIDNSVPSSVFPAVVNTAHCMDGVRIFLMQPVHINSWYRCPELNAAVGSKETSQHLLGEAVDFIAPNFGDPLYIARALSNSMIEFDQLILEHGWVHISFKSNPAEKNRRNVLSLLASGKFAVGLTDLHGRSLT